METIEMIKTIQIPRWIGSFNNQFIELVGFSDASGDATTAVIFSRIKTSNGYIISLLASKENVLPLKTKSVSGENIITIPKMELDALVTLIELYKKIIKNFSQIQTKFTAYTDSEVVLACYINKKCIYKNLC